MGRAELNIFLKALLQHDKDGCVDKALTYFRSKYCERRNKYPGDEELYDMFKRCVAEGLSLNESMLKCIRIIDREMTNLDIATQYGLPYYENWFNP